MKIHLLGVSVLHADGHTYGHGKVSCYQSLWRGT